MIPNSMSYIDFLIRKLTKNPFCSHVLKKASKLAAGFNP